jgi:hypothetical protein
VSAGPRLAEGGDERLLVGVVLRESAADGADEGRSVVFRQRFHPSPDDEL